MGFFDSFFGGGDTAEKGSEAAWGASRAINAAVNNTNDLYKQYTGQAQNILGDATSRGQGYMADAYNAAAGLISPWQTAGKDALGVYASLLGIPGYETTYSPESYLRKTPGYLWQLGQGQKALDASAAGRGMLLSGPQRQASQQYGQNLASTYYDKLMNQLMGMGNTGLTAGTTMGGWRNQLGINEANMEMESAKLRAIMENQLGSNIVGNQWKGAQGTADAINKEFQAQMAADQNSFGFGDLLGLGAGLITGPLGTNALSGLFGGGSGGGGGGYTPSWDNTLAQFNASSYGR